MTAPTPPAKEAKPKTVPGIKVIARAERFRRAGRVFTAEPTLIPLSTLDKKQVEALRAEPMLVVQDVDVPAPGKEDAEAQQE